MRVLFTNYGSVRRAAGRLFTCTALSIVFALSGSALAASVGSLADGSEIIGFGLNNNGQTGVPTGAFMSVAAGFEHSLGIRTGGTLAGWGYNGAGQINVPVGKFTAVASGNSHVLGLRDNGSLAGWGNNAYGEINVPSGSFIAIAAGGSHSLGIRSDGTLAGWGNNNYGQRTVPSGAFAAIEAGGVHSLGIRTDGTLVGWGNNDYGQTSVPSGSFAAIAAGETPYSLGIRTDGTMVGWGNTTYGTTNVPSGSFTAIAAGFYHALAVRVDGSLVGWGSNTSGQTSVPSGVFTGIAAGEAHSLALRARTEYDGDLLVSGKGVSTTLNRSINVAGDVIVEAATNLYNNPTAAISGKLIINFPAPFSGAGLITTHGLDIQTSNFTLPTSPTIINSGPITGSGILALQANGQHLDFSLDPNSLHTGRLQLGTMDATNVSMTAVGQGYQNMGGLDLFGGELRMGPAQRIRFNDGAIYNGKVELLGNAAAPSEIEFVSGLNSMTPSLITGQNAVMRFAGGLQNYGAVALSSGLNNVTGDITNLGTITVSGGAAATFYDDVSQLGTFRVGKVGSTTSTAVILGAFTGSGGTTGGGDIFFEGDLRPGNSPATVSFDNNVGLGSTANLEIELGGNTPGTEYDKLRVTGKLTLGGTLDVSLINLGGGTFEPQLGSVFEIAAATEGIAGSFATQRFPDLGELLDFRVVQQADKLLLAVVPALPGDYNVNGVVDGADYVVWRKTQDQAGVGLAADGTGPLGTPDGLVNQLDFLFWRSHFGQSLAGGTSPAAANASGAIPEPANVVLIMVAAAVATFIRVAARCHTTAIRRR